MLLASETHPMSSDDAFSKSRLCLSLILKKDPSYSYGFPEEILSDSQKKRFQEAILNLSQGMPLSRIFGEREFWSLPFKLNQSTLDPRPESELLIEVALDFLKECLETNLHILDLGTGSGCLLLSLLHNLPQATGIGIDLSFEALSCAYENSKILEVDQRSFFIQSSWTEALKGEFDIIVSNPPYIPSSEICLLDSNVKLFDPHLALDGGHDGLDPYRSLLPSVQKFLSPQGLFLVEIGSTQAQDVQSLFKGCGLKNITIHHDLENRPRVISGRLF